MAAKAPDFQPGELLPGTKYRIVKQIGAGGMGVVYQVVKPPEIQGVLKLMSTDLTAHQEFRTRFFDEVRVLAQLDHPNIVKVFDYDSLTDGTPYYVMELLHGRTVRDVLSTMGTLPPRVAFEVTRQLCEALHAAHTHDIPVVHRDIKPENVFLHAPRHGEPVVKLIDFGVVAVADRQHDGAFVGTWKYAAPEQIRGERATAATDLYAVGLLLYEMLCGSGPFEHLDSGSLVSQAHLRELPPPVSRFAPWVPPSVVKLIDVSLAKDPRQRPRDAYAFAEQLYELEWANDGRDPSTHRTAEGPLSRILSTVGAAKPESKNMVAAAPRDRLANEPVIGIPAEARHGGATLKGVGGQGNESTAPPGEDTLLAGLLDRVEHAPPSKKRAARPAPTLPAPDSGSLPDAPTQKRVAKIDTDTFSSQASDARKAPRTRSGLVIATLLLFALLSLIGLGSFALTRTRPPPPTAAPAFAPVAPVVATASAAVTAAVTTVTAAAPSAAAAAPSARAVRGRPGRPATRPELAPAGSLAPAPPGPDDSFTHAF